MADLNIVVAGASGRMGRTLVREIAQAPGLALSGALEAEGHPDLGRDAGSWRAWRPTASSLPPILCP